MVGGWGEGRKGAKWVEGNKEVGRGWVGGLE